MLCWSRTPVAVLCAAALVYAEPPIAGHLPSEVSQAISHIQPNPLRGHVSFLASDLLEGRATPSPGLDIAAEYIASRFRAAGLDPLPGTDSYYQVANWKQSRIPVEHARLRFTVSGTSIELDGARFSVQGQDGVNVPEARVFKAAFGSADHLKKLSDGHLEGHVALIAAAGPGGNRRQPGRMQEQSELREQLTRLKVAAAIVVRKGDRGSGANPQLIDPQQAGSRRGFRLPFPVAVHSNELYSLLDSLPEGETTARVSLSVPQPVQTPVVLKNVIGILRGSDPALKDTYVLVTAHYDHIGTTTPENGDGIYNGANDDASGTASVIEIAAALASQKTRPRRSILFMTVFGEERGLLGSAFYGRNPVFPLSRTVADINLEHMGRTDDNEGERKGKVSVTGFDFTDITPVFVAAGKPEGVVFDKHDKNSDAFYARSDNLALAQAGIPAHTFCVAFEFPDYHGLGDHWEKLDYDNMAKVDRAVAAGLWSLADSTHEPKWNESNDKTERYRKARAAGDKPESSPQGNNP